MTAPLNPAVRIDLSFDRMTTSRRIRLLLCAISCIVICFALSWPLGETLAFSLGSIAFVLLTFRCRCESLPVSIGFSFALALYVAALFISYSQGREAILSGDWALILLMLPLEFQIAIPVVAALFSHGALLATRRLCANCAVKA